MATRSSWSRMTGWVGAGLPPRCDRTLEPGTEPSLVNGAHTGGPAPQEPADPLEHDTRMMSELKSCDPREGVDERLALAQNGVFRGLGHAELDDPLRRNLDRFAGLRIPSHAGLSVREHQLAESRNHEGILGLLVREHSQIFQELSRAFLGNAGLARNMVGNLGFRHRFSHTDLLNMIKVNCSSLSRCG